MSTNNPYFIKGVYKDTLPITYEKSSAPKECISYENCCKADLTSFDTKIGTITNYSTSLYCIESKFAQNEDRHEEELKEIRTRIKILRREQGNQIDKAKGIQITGFPLHWVKWSKLQEEDTIEERETKDFNNNILIEKKPYFMIYIYPHLMKEYKKWTSDMDTYCKTVFGYSIEILKRRNNLDIKEQAFLDAYNKFIPVDTTPCVMNKLSNHMEKIVLELTQWKKQKEDVTYLLKSKEEVPWNKKTFESIKKIYSINKITNYHDESKTADKYNLIHDEMLFVCDNEQELLNYCLHINENLPWQLKLESLVNNVYNNRQDIMTIPIPDEEGDIEYLNKRYSAKVVEAW